MPPTASFHSKLALDREQIARTGELKKAARARVEPYHTTFTPSCPCTAWPRPLSTAKL